MTKRVLAFSTLLLVVLLLLSPVLVCAQDEPLAKGERAGQPFLSQVPSQPSGGPDGYGYVWDTVAYSWAEISGTGTRATEDILENRCRLVDIGFTFQFYGADKTQLYICADGYLTFQTPYSGWMSSWRVLCPVISPASGLDTDDGIYGFWDDLDADTGDGSPFGGGDVYYETRGTAPNRVFIVEFKDVQYWGATHELTFEIMLYEGSGDILVQYYEVTDRGDVDAWDGLTAAVGIENATGTDGLTYGCGVDDLAYDRLAVLFHLPQPEPSPEPVPPVQEFIPEWGSIALLGSGAISLAGYAALRWRYR